MSKVFRVWCLLLIAITIISVWMFFDWCAAGLTACGVVCGWWLREIKAAKDEETEDDAK